MKLLNDETFAAADGEKGRLRTFLLFSLNRHLADQQRHDGRQKRGGGEQIIAFEEMNAEERYAHEPQDQRDPERLFTQAWAHLLIDGVRGKLRESFEETGRVGVFEALLPFLLGYEAPLSCREVALKLEASETAGGASATGSAYNPATGLWSVIDPQATNPSRFYRVAY